MLRKYWLNKNLRAGDVAQMISYLPPVSSGMKSVTDTSGVVAQPLNPALDKWSQEYQELRTGVGSQPELGS